VPGSNAGPCQLLRAFAVLAAARSHSGCFPPPPVPGGDAEGHFRPYCDIPGAVHYLRAVEREIDAPFGTHFPEANLGVETDHAAPCRSSEHLGPGEGRAAHATILLMGSSMMSEAPASLSSGISLLIASFGTTVSTA